MYTACPINKLRCLNIRNRKSKLMNKIVRRIQKLFSGVGIGMRM